MGKVIADQSMSLDGFSAGSNVGVGNGMGNGGEQLHAWMFSEGDGAEIDASVREDTPFTLLQRSGAVVVGRPPALVDLPCPLLLTALESALRVSVTAAGRASGRSGPHHRTFRVLQQCPPRDAAAPAAMP